MPVLWATLGISGVLQGGATGAQESIPGCTVNPDGLNPTHLSTCPDPEIADNLNKVTSAGTPHAAFGPSSVPVTGNGAPGSSKLSHYIFLGGSLRSTETKASPRDTQVRYGVEQ